MLHSPAFSGTGSNRSGMASASLLLRKALMWILYLIMHPKGTLMWDTGSIPDANLKSDASPATQGRFTATKTLKVPVSDSGLLRVAQATLFFRTYGERHAGNTSTRATLPTNAAAQSPAADLDRRPVTGI